MSKPAPVLQVEKLHKTFRIGFFRKRVDAVRGVDFSVRPGEIFGLLGPNGAGKTTTLKMVLRLIFPTEGTIRILGTGNDDPETMRRVGYMPENPYVYQYLRPLEFLDLCGRLAGLPGAERRRRGLEMVEMVGLQHAVDRPIGKFSKGMMQRIGLAQALLHDPELLILDEPMSGLDPIGRKQIRDVLVEQRRRDKTLIFTSHILSDVEMLCDRVAIMHEGRITARGSLDELLSRDVRRVDIELSSVTPETRAELEALPSTHLALPAEGDPGDRLLVSVEGEDGVQPLLSAALTGGARVDAVVPRRETLEDLFVRDAVSGGSERSL